MVGSKRFDTAHLSQLPSLSKVTILKLESHSINDKGFTHFSLMVIDFETCLLTIMEILLTEQIAYLGRAGRMVKGPTIVQL